MAHYRWQDLNNALGFVAQNINRLPFDRVLSQPFRLTEINRAFELQNDGLITRSALVPGS
jgi:Zn-dependent alcohol dehydrogenase